MQFRTELFPDKYKIRFDYHKRYFLLGSCFSDNIGQIMQRHCFSVVSNPFGTVYNPSSMRRQLDILDNQIPMSPLVFNPDTQLYFDYDLHSSFNNSDSVLTLDKIEYERLKASEFIKNTDVAIITLGTAWVYRLNESGIIVANCHKMPQKLFAKELLSISEINDQLKSITYILKKYNPSMEIIFTVSPVRHIKDGLTENCLSKARLLTSIHELLHQDLQLAYFPSYELMIDDLRDYRFYNQDLIHPSNMAIEYIWNKLMATYFDDDTKGRFQKIAKLKNFLDHRPVNAFDPQYLDQKAKYQAELNKLCEL